MPQRRRKPAPRPKQPARVRKAKTMPRLAIDATLLRLGVGEEMVKVHRGRVMEKMRAGSLAELVRLVDEGGVTSPHAAAPSAQSSS